MIATENGYLLRKLEDDRYFYFQTLNEAGRWQCIYCLSKAYKSRFPVTARFLEPEFQHAILQLLTAPPRPAKRTLLGRLAAFFGF